MFSIKAYKSHRNNLLSPISHPYHRPFHRPLSIELEVRMNSLKDLHQIIT